MEIIDPSNSIPNRPSEHKCKTIIIEGVAWFGSGLVLTAYIFPLNNELDLVFNVIGAASLLGVCIKKKAFQPTLLNTAWIIGGLYKYFSS